jgi:hypothetical protein
MDGHLPMRQLLSGRDRANIGSFVTMLHDYKPYMPYRRYMPPVVGKQQDVNDFSEFLNAKVNPPAAGSGSNDT